MDELVHALVVRPNDTKIEDDSFSDRMSSATFSSTSGLQSRVGSYINPSVRNAARSKLGGAMPNGCAVIKGSNSAVRIRMGKNLIVKLIST
jgi:hypothetical protein